MKKIIASAVGLVLVGGVAVTTASAVESQFGGYWRTRSYFEKGFFQENPKRKTVSATDTRTRLYYTAKFSDDLKFVNKFEFNTTWGDSNGGDVGADGKGNWRIKNSYIDAKLGMVNTTVGIQSATIHRGFIFGDDFSGVIATADFGTVKVPFMYAAVSNADANTLGWDGSTAKSMGYITNSQNGQYTEGNGNGDVNMFGLLPKIDINENISLNPVFVYTDVTQSSTYLWYLGADVDAKFDAFSAWGTVVYNGGELDAGTNNIDIEAWLVAAGADVSVFHTQGFYATGDGAKNVDDNSTIDSFVLVGSNGYGASYYWSEIMGLGTFDNRVDSNAAMGDKITNIWALNAGVTLKPMDKLTLNLDAWYAENVQEVVVNGKDEDKLGLELDAKLSYQVLDNLKADFIYAYLFAGDALGGDDIQEGGVQLSLSF